MMFRLILVILLLHGSTAGLDRCPEQRYQHWFKLGPFCAKYFAYKQNFDNAELKCRQEAEDGHLISVHDQETSEGVRLLTGSSHTTAWIGGFRLPNGVDFIWTDGSKWDYRNFLRWEPNHSGNCVQINYDTPGKWDDVHCWSELGYICAFKIKQHY